VIDENPDRKAPSASEPLAPDHKLDTFDSGVPALDDWQKRRARANEAEGASRTFVTCSGRRVVGYYSLAAGAVLSAARLLFPCHGSVPYYEAGTPKGCR
jgi:hypothetical protein